MRYGIILALAAVQTAGAAVIVTTSLETKSFAHFDYQGHTYDQSQDITGVSAVSAQALAGNFATPEARTAARLNGSEIAANARLDDQFKFSGIHVNFDFSQSIYSAVLQKASGPAANITASFYLPPSYLEVSSFVEFPTARLIPVFVIEMLADPCLGEGCSATTDIFHFAAELDASWERFVPILRADVVPAGLDISPLLNPVITDTIDNGLRTTHMAFPGFGGTVVLGTLDAGQALSFTYKLDTHVEGDLDGNVGISSVNDPFFFDGDRIGAGAPVAISEAETAAPEPATAADMLLGLAAVWRRARR